MYVYNPRFFQFWVTLGCQAGLPLAMVVALLPHRLRPKLTTSTMRSRRGERQWLGWVWIQWQQCSSSEGRSKYRAYITGNGTHDRNVGWAVARKTRHRGFDSQLDLTFACGLPSCCVQRERIHVYYRNSGNFRCHKILCSHRRQRKLNTQNTHVISTRNYQYIQYFRYYNMPILLQWLLPIWRYKHGSLKCSKVFATPPCL